MEELLREEEAGYEKGLGGQKGGVGVWVGLISFIDGVLQIPYCWAAKSRRKEVGASHFAVEEEMPMMLAMGVYMLDTEDAA